jgi:lipopolysaccharide transport system permease protein
LNPFARHPAGLAHVFGSIARHRTLLWQLALREVAGRYRGSLVGLLWSFFNPLLMLLVYTFVFSVVFRARWPGVGEGRLEFAILAFCGMIVHGLFAECVNRAPTLVLGNPNLVKKVVFPLEILPWSVIGSALFHTAVSLGVLLGFVALARGGVPWTVLYFPLVLAPYVLFIAGVSWWLASIGVYVRDVAHTTGLATTVLLFLSPVFYPVSALPEAYRPLLHLNPLTFVIEQAREVLIGGRAPHWAGLAAYALFGLAAAWAGLYWFQRTRKGFADVL